MANSFSGRQWMIDTPFTVTKGAGGIPGSVSPAGAAPLDLMLSNIEIAQIEYTDYATSADEVVIKDREGRTLWVAHGDANPGTPVRTGYVGWAQGFQVPPPMPAGSRLIIYLR